MAVRLIHSHSALILTLLVFEVPRRLGNSLGSTEFPKHPASGTHLSSQFLTIKELNLRAIIEPLMVISSDNISLHHVFISFLMIFKGPYAL